MSKQKTKENIAIVGGGIGGCATALALAENGVKTTIIEGLEELLSATSDHTPGRMGLGFHYLSDPETAVMYLKATIEFARKHQGFMIGEREGDNPRLKHGRYFVTPDSFVSPDDVVACANHIQAAYAALVAEDASNAVFGPPESFYRILDPSEYVGDVNPERVALAIETQEHLLDWPRFKQHLLEKITDNPHITVIKGYKVTATSCNAAGDGFVISAKDANGESHTIESSHVINATWQNIEALNATMGFQMVEGSRTNRLKLLLEVELPEAMQDKPSMFFCMGPHSMFTNLGNGLGRMTYAPVTNFADTHKEFEVLERLLQVPEQYERWMNHGLSPDEVALYGQQILEGAIKYMPGLEDAKIKAVYPGIVKSKGTVEIYNPDSAYHKRAYSGVDEQQIDWIDNACMKLFYCEKNAERIVDILKEHVKADKTIANHLMPAVNNNVPAGSGSAIISGAVKNHVRRNFTANEFSDEDFSSATIARIVSSMKNKKEANREVVGRFTKQVVVERKVGNLLEKENIMPSLASKQIERNDALYVAQLMLFGEMVTTSLQPSKNHFSANTHHKKEVTFQEQLHLFKKEFNQLPLSLKRVESFGTVYSQFNTSGRNTPITVR